jgi:hypothetical protein
MHALLTRELRDVERGVRVRDARMRRVRQPVLAEQLLVMPPEIEAVATLEVLDRDPLRRILRMQVEWKPLDLSAVPALEPRRALGRDVAEGSYVVGPDPDQRWHTSGLYPIVWLSRCRTQPPYEIFNAGVEGRIAGSSPAATPAYLVSRRQRSATPA